MNTNEVNVQQHSQVVRVLKAVSRLFSNDFFQMTFLERHIFEVVRKKVISPQNKLGEGERYWHPILT